MHSFIKSILLIDDDQDDKFFFSSALEQVDPAMTLYTAFDGQDALDKLKFVCPDIILLDLVMPGMNGLAFLKAVKKDRLLKEIPIVIYTASVSDFERSELIKIGACQIYIKPVTYEATVQLIPEILKLGMVRNSA
jgi:CheY-like chemotaxis protein